MYKPYDLIDETQGIQPGPKFDYIENYLSYRSQYATIGAADSRMRVLDRGVPQGSVMGPLLYSLYINEMMETVVGPDCREAVHSN